MCHFIFMPGLARSFLSVPFVKHFPTQSHGKAATTQWAACNVTVLSQISLHCNEEANCTKIPIHTQICIKCLQNDNWNLTGRDEMLSHRWKERWGRTRCTACCSWMRPPQTSLLPFWVSKSPFTSRNIRPWYHFSSRQALNELRLTRYPQTHR